MEFNLFVPTLCGCTAERLQSLGRLAVVVGHPGHELKLFGLLSECKPQVHVITDGSGREGISRLPATRKLLDSVGATPGILFGVVSDRQIYQAILEKQFSLFVDLVERLAFSFISDDIRFVAGDATEGFNPTHDICRLMINAAVLMANRLGGKEIGNYEVQLTGWERRCADQHDEKCLHLQLDSQLLRKKLEAANEYMELREEVSRSLTYFGEEYFRTECLRKVTEPLVPVGGTAKPFYETLGEERVATGAYKSVIRYQEHMLPLMNAVYDHASELAIQES